MLELLLDTVEDYQREVEIDRELYQVIALDAKGIPQSRITARHAADLLAKAARTAADSRECVGPAGMTQAKRTRFNIKARRTATAH